MRSQDIPAVDESKFSPTLQYFIVKINNNSDPKLKEYKKRALGYIQSRKGSMENPPDRYFMQLISDMNDEKLHSEGHPCGIIPPVLQSRICDFYEKEAIAYVQTLDAFKKHSEKKISQPSVSSSVSLAKNISVFWSKNAPLIAGAAIAVVISAAATRFI
jgi:hypothetical protein